MRTANQPPAGIYGISPPPLPGKPGILRNAGCAAKPWTGRKRKNLKCREVPVNSLSVTCVPQPILTHKLAESYSGEKLDALKRLVNGGCMGTKIDISKDGQPVTQKTIRSILADDNSKLIEKIKKGVTSFYSPQIVLQARYKVTDPGTINYQKACTIAAPPGPFESPSGKFNWMSMGTSVEGSGKEWQVTDTYMLSGPDGWDEDIYDK